MGRRMVAATATVLGMALGTALAGCADDGSDPGQPAPSADATSSAAGSPQPSTEPSADSSSEPSVEPASGPMIRTRLAQVRAPEGWQAGQFPFGSIQVDAGKGSARLTLFELANLAPGSITLDEMAKNTRQTSPHLRRLPDVTLDGQPAIHMAGPMPHDPRRIEHVFSLDYQEHGIVLGVRARKEQVEELVAAILPTFEWRR